MNIVICGAGHVGLHAAEQLSSEGNNVTVVDHDVERIRKIEDTLDVRTFSGNCASAEIQREVRADNAELVIAATNDDQINLFTAAIAKGVGAARSIARVHHSTYFEQRGLDYKEHFGIDELICPEYSTALAMAQALRNPGAIAVENFARGDIEMQEFPVGSNAPAVGIALSELGLPQRTRLAAITRRDQMFIPDGASVIEAGDIVVMVGNRSVFEDACRLFWDRKPRRKKLVIMGGPAMAVWLCRALRKQDFSIRLFELRRNRAEELADKLDWVTVIQADPTDPAVMEDERIQSADSFVALLDDDEHNILSCAWAKSLGVQQAVATVQRADYLRLMERVGIDRPFSPRQVAVTEIRRLLEQGTIRRVSSLSRGVIDVYWVQVGEKSKTVGRPLREVKLTPDWVVAAINHDCHVVVPSAADVITTGDTLLVIGRAGMESKLRKLFDAR